MKSHLKLWQNLCAYMINFESSGISKRKLYDCIIEWLRKYSNQFNSQTWEAYRFDAYMELDPTEYPLEYSETEVNDYISKLVSVTPSSKDSIAMMLRDILWDLLAFKSEINCVNCNDDDYRVLYDLQKGVNVLSCDLCCWAQYENGAKWDGSQTLFPAKLAQLKSSGYIRN